MSNKVCDAPMLRNGNCGELAEFVLTVEEIGSGYTPHKLYRCYQHAEAIKRVTRSRAGYTPSGKYRLVFVEPLES